MPPQSPQDQRAIVQRMIDAGESEENIATVIQHFKKIPTDPTEGRSVTSRAIGGYLTGSGIAGIPSLVGGLLTHPVDTVVGLAKNVVSPLARLSNVPEAYRQGGMTGAANEVASSLPIIGPAAEHASQRMKSGDTAGGAGEVVGMMTTPFLKVPKTLSATIAERIAPIAERASQSRMVETIAPKVGANKVRFGNQAAEVAPRLAREEGMNAATRAGLADKVSAKLAESESALDVAHDARNAGRAYATAPMIKSLQAERAKLTASAVKGSERTPTEGLSPSGLVKVPEAVPIGRDVVPSPNATRVGIIDKAISELRQLGSLARYDAIRQVRAAYDQVAKVKYAPSMTQDFLTKAGEASGAADVTRVLREHLANMDPGTAKANASYAFWRKVDDVLTAVDETERVRPSRGRAIATRTTGAIGGAIVGHDLLSIATGVIIAEGAERLAASGATTKIASSRALARLSDALRNGKTAQSQSALQQLAAYAGLSARLTSILNQQKEPQ